MVFIATFLFILGTLFIFLGGKFFLDEVVASSKPLIPFASSFIAYFSSAYHLILGVMIVVAAFLLIN